MKFRVRSEGNGRKRGDRDRGDSSFYSFKQVSIPSLPDQGKQERVGEDTDGGVR